MYYFKPMEIAYQELSNAVMAALLINDINNPNCNANANRKLEQPWDLFKVFIYICMYVCMSIKKNIIILYYVYLVFT